jgi:hypothetical protein
LAETGLLRHGAALAVKPAHGAAHAAGFDIQIQPGSLQQRHAADLGLIKCNTSRHHAAIAMHDNQPGLVGP